MPGLPEGRGAARGRSRRRGCRWRRYCGGSAALGGVRRASAGGCNCRGDPCRAAEGDAGGAPDEAEQLGPPSPGGRETVVASGGSSRRRRSSGAGRLIQGRTPQAARFWQQAMERAGGESRPSVGSAEVSLGSPLSLGRRSWDPPAFLRRLDPAEEKGCLQARRPLSRGRCAPRDCPAAPLVRCRACGVSDTASPTILKVSCAHL